MPGAGIASVKWMKPVSKCTTLVPTAVVELAHRIEREELEPEPANLKLLLDLAGRDSAPSPRFAAR